MVTEKFISKEINAGHGNGGKKSHTNYESNEI